MAENPQDSTPNHIDDAPDASSKEIVSYAVGTIPNGFMEGLNIVFMSIMVITLGMSPLLVGLMLALKTIWDAISDPLMAYFTDNIRTRYGRRRPFILIGGLAMPVILCLMWFSVPTNAVVTYNENHPASAMNAKPVVEEKADAVEKEVQKPALPKPKKSLWQNLTEGIDEAKNMDERTRQVFWIVLIGILALATAQTVYGTAYYALGIELCPSYDGRTKVTVYRSVAGQILGLAKQWIQPFVFGALFISGVHGMRWLGIIAILISVPCILITFFNTTERTPLVPEEKNDKVPKRMGFFKGMWMVISNFHILRVFALQKIVGISNSVFAQLGIFLNIYYVFGGKLNEGSAFAAVVGSLGWLIGFLMLPVVNMGCRKFEKHRVFAFSIAIMAVGTIVKWFVFVPGNPNLQLFLPFFFAIGLTSFYTVLGTMYADLTDVDELRTGERREAMMGATMSFFNKLMDVMQSLLTGVILTASGFVVANGANQEPGVFFNMRVFFSLVPASVLILGLLLLYRYPLTRAKLAEVKRELSIRRAQKASASS